MRAATMRNATMRNATMRNATMRTGTMGAPTAAMAVPTTLPWLVRRGALTLWHELPQALVAGVVVLAATIPFVAGRLADAPLWLLALTTVPAALALTGLAQFTAAAAQGQRMAGLRGDPVLAAVIAVAASAAGFGLAAGGLPAVVGAVGAAVLLLIAPLALAYGAVRGRSGLAAVRGGVILAAFRPSWALTLLALGVIGGFAVIASVGFLALAVVPLLLSIATSLVTAMLDDIDVTQEVEGRR